MENFVGNHDPIQVFHNRCTSLQRKVGTACALEDRGFGNRGWTEKSDPSETSLEDKLIRSLTSQTPRRSAVPHRMIRSERFGELEHTIQAGCTLSDIVRETSLCTPVNRAETTSESRRIGNSCDHFGGRIWRRICVRFRAKRPRTRDT